MRNSLARSASRFTLRLETLENRCVLAAAVGFDGTTLTITGDQTRNEVEIHDLGSGGVEIFCDGEQLNLTTESGDGSKAGTININTLQQIDTVNYYLEADYTSTTMREFNIDLGQHHDFFTAYLQGHDLEDASSLRINVNGNNGKDTSQVFADGTPATDRTDDDFNVDIAEAASLTFDVDGNNGKDPQTLVNYTGVNEGILNVLIDQTGTTTDDSETDADNPRDHANGKDIVEVNLFLRPDNDDEDDDLGGTVNVTYSGDDEADGANPGSNGKDNILINIQDESGDGDFINVDVFTHNGPDTVDVTIDCADESETPDAITYGIYGGNGPDKITLEIIRDASDMPSAGTVDGGRGPDEENVSETTVENNTSAAAMALYFASLGDGRRKTL